MNVLPHCIRNGEAFKGKPPRLIYLFGNVSVLVGFPTQGAGTQYGCIALFQF